MGGGQSVEDSAAVNPLFCADNALEKEMSDKLEDANQVANLDANFGQQQSPINFVTDHHMQCKHTVMMGDEEHGHNPLKFQYPQFVKNCTIMNNGHTVQVNIDPSNKCLVNIAGKEFKLVQFHFHTPSEHTVDAQLFDMEMHLVHVNEKSEIAVLGFMFTTKQKYQRPKLELTKSRAHLVLSSGQSALNGKNGNTLKIMKESDDEESDDQETDDEWDADDADLNKLGKSKKGNDFLDQFWSQLPAKKTERDIKLKKPLSFDYLFETSSNNFVKNVKTNEIDIDMEIYTYKGSLTTPPFTEGVNWMVSKTTHFINNKQLKKLSACWNNENNARDVQDYCGRQVKLRSKSSLQVV